MADLICNILVGLCAVFCAISSASVGVDNWRYRGLPGHGGSAFVACAATVAVALAALLMASVCGRL